MDESRFLIRIACFLGMGIILLTFIGSCARDNSKDEDRARIEVAALKIDLMKMKYDPVDFLSEDAIDSVWHNMRYTYQIDSALRALGTRPIIFFASILDIKMSDTAALLTMWNDYPTAFSEGGLFKLQCSRTTVEALAAIDTGDYSSGFAVVARIEKISKSLLTLAVEAEALDDEVIESYINLEVSSLYVIRGTFVDAEYVPDIYDYMRYSE